MQAPVTQSSSPNGKPKSIQELGSNLGVVEVEHPEQFTQVLAVSDVHGMYSTIIDLLKNNSVIDTHQKWMAGKTLLIVVGDSIDKGDHSVEVLDLWMRLSQEASAVGGRLIHVLGNHEAELLAYGKEDSKAKELFREFQRKGIKKKRFLSEESAWGQFLRSMPVAAKVGHWLFCHAGLYPDMSWKDFVAQANQEIRKGNYESAFLVGPQSILEAKDWWSDTSKRKKLVQRLKDQGLFGVVQGHQPKAYGINNKIGAIDGGHLIKIDNGMAPEAGSHSGSLLRFKNPAQMNSDLLPSLEVLTAKGKQKELTLDSLE